MPKSDCVANAMPTAAMLSSSPATAMPWPFFLPLPVLTMPTIAKIALSSANTNDPKLMMGINEVAIAKRPITRAVMAIAEVAGCVAAAPICIS